MGSLQTAMVGAAGEHYIMYQLLMRGYIAALTPTGAQGVDILISDQTGDRLAAIQVKTASEEVRDGWQMNEKHENLSNERLYYCFVCPGPKLLPAPKCWIVPSAVVAAHLRSTHQAWLSGNPQRGTSRQDTPRRKMHLAFKSPLLNEYEAGWMDRYVDNWDKLKTATA